MEVIVIHKSLCYPLSLRAGLKKFPNKARIIALSYIRSLAQIAFQLVATLGRIRNFTKK